MPATSKISIVIPVFNVSDYLTDCVQSVLNQTHTNIELLCVNDASTDSSQTVLNTLSLEDPRMKTFVHTNNKGLAAARNTGLQHSSGDFVFFLDSDDVLADRNALEVLHEAMIEDHADEVIGRMMYWWPETDERTLDWHASFLKRPSFRACPIESCLDQRSNVSACNKLFNLSFLRRNSIVFNEKLLKHEDNPFSAQVHCLADRISYIPKTTYLYRQRTSGTTSIMHDVTSYEAMYWYIKFDIETLKAFHVQNIQHSRRRLYYEGMNWRIETFKSKFPGATDNPDLKMKFVPMWKEFLDMIPKDDLSYFSSVVTEMYTFAASGDFDSAWKRLPSVSA